VETPLALGRHRARQVDDVIEVAFVGPLMLAEAVALHERIAEVFAERGSCYLLADLAALEGLGPDVRRYIGEWHKTHRLSGAALHGASVAMRAIASLTVKAIGMLGNHRTPVVFLRDEPEARRWISARRDALGST
jgi:hypothetical protein